MDNQMKSPREIRVSKNEFLRKEYIQSQIKQAEAFLKFKYPEKDIVVEEHEKEIIVKAIEKENTLKATKKEIDEGDGR